MLSWEMSQKSANNNEFPNTHIFRFLNFFQETQILTGENFSQKNPRDEFTLILENKHEVNFFRGGFLFCRANGNFHIGQ